MKNKKKKHISSSYFKLLKKSKESQPVEIEAMGVGPKTISTIINSLENDDNLRIRRMAEGFSEYEVANILEMLDNNLRMKFISILGDKFQPEVLPELNEVVQEQVVDSLSDAQLVNIANELDSDEVVELLEHLDEDEQNAIIRKLNPELKHQVKSSLMYPEDSAGRIMVREFVVIPDDWTVKEAKKYLLDENSELPEDFYTIFLINDKYEPTGEISLDKLLRAKPNTKLDEIMDGEVTPINVYTDQEEVAHMFREYGWIAATVVDKRGRLVGVINIDDIVHIIHEEASEDAMYMSGADEGDIYRPVLGIFKSRATWLSTNLFATIFASYVIDGFQDIIVQIAAIAVLLPIVASMAGTTGNQTLAVIIRALATKELNSQNTKKMILKEFLVGICNGLLFATLVAGVTLFRFPQYQMLALVIGLAMLITLTIAGLAGILIPLILVKFKVDPAIASNIFLIAITDSGGFFIFLTLAKYILF